MVTNNEFLENIDYSDDWLTEEIIKTSFREKETGKVEVVSMKKIDLFRLVQKFIKLNKRGE